MGAWRSRNGVGSPAYLQGRVTPETPADFRNHACVRFRFPSGAIYSWQFERDGKEIDVEVAGPITLDYQELMIDAALQGCGLAYVWEGRVRGHIAAGTLVQCLDDWCAVDENLFLYYPSRRYVSAGLRALIELLKC
jgi:DNA-binding transcriptional LysR family regulator